MQEYINLKTNHMDYLIGALDGNLNNIVSNIITPLPTSVNGELIRAAAEFLSKRWIIIENRRIWPGGGMPIFRVKGKIAEKHQAQYGRALCYWGDPIWGKLVRDGKYKDNRFCDELVTACANLVREWKPDPSPTWVTCIPSLRHPILVPDFAKRLARALNLQFIDALEKILERPNQKEMANSILQARNLDGAIYCRKITVPEEPVLLVDDMVDSKWTFTVAAWLLQLEGSGKVFPFALANTGYDL